jgi:glycosyltransferase involved in cell wall biosynthesis
MVVILPSSRKMFRALAPFPSEALFSKCISLYLAFVQFAGDVRAIMASTHTAKLSSSTIAIIPAYNCEVTLPGVIEGIRRQGLEIVVVDDGSHDGTAIAACAAGVKVLSHSANKGKGHALITGFLHALKKGAEAVITLDADGQHDPEDIPKFLSLQGTSELVIGKRQINLERMPRASFIGNSISTFFISRFCQTRFPDTQCGYRLYSKKLLCTLPLHGGRFETETELLMRTSLLGLSIQWVSIKTLYDTGLTPYRSNFNHFHDTLRVIRVVLGSMKFPRANAS